MSLLSVTALHLTHSRLLDAKNDLEFTVDFPLLTLVRVSSSVTQTGTWREFPRALRTVLSRVDRVSVRKMPFCESLLCILICYRHILKESFQPLTIKCGRKNILFVLIKICASHFVLRTV